MPVISCHRPSSPRRDAASSTCNSKRSRRNAFKILLVEFRDEVAARLIVDLRSAGARVRRASAATDAYPWAAQADLVIVNQTLPDESGWLLAAKLALATNCPPVWLLAGVPSLRHETYARMAGVEAVFYDRGDVFLLSAALVERLSSRMATSKVR